MKSLAFVATTLLAFSGLQSGPAAARWQGQNYARPAWNTGAAVADRTDRFDYRAHSGHRSVFLPPSENFGGNCYRTRPLGWRRSWTWCD